MAVIPVTAYGSLFAAIGCRLNFDSKTAQLRVADIPKTVKKYVDAALEDISHFEDTANFADGMSAIHLAQTIDDEKNKLDDSIKTNVLTALGIVKDGRFVAQVIAQQKTNRSWHLSEKPNTCTYFGDLCTHRGITNIPGKRGRKSTRNPDQYHKLSSAGEIGREQLVTPALENLVAHIPADSIISVKSSNGFVGGINLDALSEEQITEMVERINKIRAQREESKEAQPV